MTSKYNPLHIEWINTIWNKTKGALVCTLIGHDVVMTQCFRCWKWDKTWGDN